jgi:hypothetical protein
MSDDPFDSIIEDFDKKPAPQSASDGDSQGDDKGAGNSSGGRNYAQELISEKISGRQRTFFIDLKESGNGKFIKMSELSRGGQRSTIMFDIEDLDPIIEGLQKVKKAA